MASGEIVSLDRAADTTCLFETSIVAYAALKHCGLRTFRNFDFLDVCTSSL